MKKEISYVDSVDFPSEKRVLLRVDFNVPINQDGTIADDTRITQSLPTIQKLLSLKSKLILVSHFGRPDRRDKKYSLDFICTKLQTYFPQYRIILIGDFLSDFGKEQLAQQTENDICILENIRFYKEEEVNDKIFTESLALLADVYVNNAFSASHRDHASVVGVPKYLPSYGGLLLKKEVTILSRVLQKPRHPFIVVVGGTKVTTKLHFIKRFIGFADYILFGGGVANTFLKARGFNIGKSIYEKEQLETARDLLKEAAASHTIITLPIDCLVAETRDSTISRVVRVRDVKDTDYILDLGTDSKAEYAHILTKAYTIIWSGPIGYFENSVFRQGTDFLYYTIAYNREATAVIGGGDTLAAISHNPYLEKITHISTGGSAMLAFMEDGTLPGIHALEE